MIFLARWRRRYFYDGMGVGAAAAAYTVKCLSVAEHPTLTGTISMLLSRLPPLAIWRFPDFLLAFSTNAMNLRSVSSAYRHRGHHRFIGNIRTFATLTKVLCSRFSLSIRSRNYHTHVRRQKPAAVASNIDQHSTPKMPIARLSRAFARRMLRTIALMRSRRRSGFLKARPRYHFFDFTRRFVTMKLTSIALSALEALPVDGRATTFYKMAFSPPHAPFSPPPSKIDGDATFHL